MIIIRHPNPESINRQSEIKLARLKQKYLYIKLNDEEKAVVGEIMTKSKSQGRGDLSA